ncbi:pirin family protein [Brevibacillus sp. H7]|uniref:pirin family protein n=1 Tax=Brevibacillus sp. H7 TaxID=3349138 RepID=UPI00380A4299
MNISVYNLDQQGVGNFGGGRIIESKPIAFPHEETAVKRVGPLFYWSWAKGVETFEIPLHPHSGFEILTYVLKGTVGHSDTLKNFQRVSAGGAQVMQTGSGVYHAENIEKDAELFQIWFEPHLAKTTKQTPTYNQYEHEDFPLSEENGVKLKTIIGKGSPISLETDTSMFDAEISEGKTFTYSLRAGKALAVVAVQGSGSVGSSALERGDFSVVTTDEDAQVIFSAAESEGLRIVFIEVPQEVDYPLYRK